MFPRATFCVVTPSKKKIPVKQFVPPLHQQRRLLSSSSEQHFSPTTSSQVHKQIQRIFPLQLLRACQEQNNNFMKEDESVECEEMRQEVLINQIENNTSIHTSFGQTKSLAQIFTRSPSQTCSTELFERQRGEEEETGESAARLTSTAVLHSLTIHIAMMLTNNRNTTSNFSLHRACHKMLRRLFRHQDYLPSMLQTSSSFSCDVLGFTSRQNQLSSLSIFASTSPQVWSSAIDSLGLCGEVDQTRQLVRGYLDVVSLSDSLSRERLLMQLPASSKLHLVRAFLNLQQGEQGEEEMMRKEEEEPIVCTVARVLVNDVKNFSQLRVRKVCGNQPSISFGLVAHTLHSLYRLVTQEQKQAQERENETEQEEEGNATSTTKTSSSSSSLLDLAENFFRQVASKPSLITTLLETETEASMQPQQQEEGAAASCSTSSLTALNEHLCLYLDTILRLLESSMDFATSQEAQSNISAVLCQILVGFRLPKEFRKQQGSSPTVAALPATAGTSVDPFRPIAYVASVLELLVARGCLRPALDVASVWISCGAEIVDMRFFHVSLVESLLMAAKSSMSPEEYRAPWNFLVQNLMRMYRQRDWFRHAVTSRYHHHNNNSNQQRDDSNQQYSLPPICFLSSQQQQQQQQATSSSSSSSSSCALVELSIDEETHSNVEEHLGLVLSPAGCFMSKST